MKKTTDVQAVKRFLFSVLKWAPDAVLRQATLEDICDAITGYREGLGLSPPQKNLTHTFMTEMMKKFPDGEKNDTGT